MQLSISPFVMTINVQFMKKPNMVQAIGHKNLSQRNSKEQKRKIKFESQIRTLYLFLVQNQQRG